MRKSKWCVSRSDIYYTYGQYGQWKRAHQQPHTPWNSKYRLQKLMYDRGIGSGYRTRSQLPEGTSTGASGMESAPVWLATTGRDDTRPCWQRWWYFNEAVLLRCFLLLSPLATLFFKLETLLGRKQRLVSAAFAFRSLGVAKSVLFCYSAISASCYVKICQRISVTCQTRPE